jgi:hypothetical protein
VIERERGREGDWCLGAALARVRIPAGPGSSSHPSQLEEPRPGYNLKLARRGTGNGSQLTCGTI